MKAIASLAAVALAAALLIAFGTEIIRLYGYGIFLLIPAAVGFTAGLVYDGPARDNLVVRIAAAEIALALTAAALMVFAVEGAVCLVMTLPLAAPAAAVGAVATHVRRYGVGEKRKRDLTLVGAAVPLFLVLEPLIPYPAPVEPVRTEIIVAAPIETVWEHVIAFEPLPEPTEFFFRSGVAYPLRAEIEGEGPGAVRRCIFSTGEFVEPVTAWERPTRLAFDVVESPIPMQEWTPYEEIHPAHLDGYFRSTRGQFELAQLPDGRTRLTGTTWRIVEIHPAPYWELWADWIIHRIHLRVLLHIQAQAEAEA